MPDISLMLDIRAKPELVFNLVSTPDGIRRWWTSTVTEGQASESDIVVRFGDNWKLSLQKLSETPNQSVVFRITEHDSDEWLTTELSFSLEPSDDWTILRFDHRRWADKTDFFRFCSTKWAVFLLSIKQAAETGEGTPYPSETKIGRND